MLNKFLYLLLIISSYSFGQVTGNLKYHANQQIKLLGYNGFNTIELAKTTIDKLGNFYLINNIQYNGMGYLETEDNNQLFIVINEPNIIINGTHLKELDNIEIENSTENQIFNQYAKEHNQRENALAGWKHILPQYQSILLFKEQKETLKIIQKEIERIENEDVLYLNNMDKKTYVSWFLPLRKLLDDIPLSAKNYPNRIPKHLANFRKIDFNNDKLYSSGILDDLIESHYWLIENSGLDFDSMYAQMNYSTDYLIENLKTNSTKLNEISKFLFGLLEKKSLFKASEYLALQLLTQSSCTINDDLTAQLESYRLMKIGNIAKDISFTGTTIINGTEVTSDFKLSSKKNTYSLIVFGASWCQKCTEEIPLIKEYYKKWKELGVEVFFVSLDTDKKEFIEFVKDFPWVSTSDFKSWDTQTARDYHVFSTPTLFLLDKERKILLRPNSIEHTNAWIKAKLLQ